MNSYVFGLILFISFSSYWQRNIYVLSEERLSAQSEKTGFMDFDQFAKEYVEAREREYYRSASWFDVYGKHPFLRSTRDYEKYRVHVSVGNFAFSNLTQLGTKSEVVHTQLLHNNSSKPVTHNVTKGNLPTGEYHWTVEKGIHIKEITTFKTTVPDSTETITVNFQTAEEQVYKFPSTFSVTTSVVVQPRTDFEVKLHVQRKESQYDFKAFVYIDGYVAIWFFERYENHWLWFHPICKMADDRFQAAGNGLLRRISGKLTVIAYENSMVEKRAFPVY